MKNLKKKLILIVDDDKGTVFLEKQLLERCGYEVITAYTGEEAVKIFNLNNNIDLILMDINLGNGIDGTKAAKKILKIKEIPIVFLSNHTEPEIVEKTEKVTSYGYVVKNSQITVLDASIKMAFKLFNSKMKEKEKDAALIESEKRLRMALDNASDGVYDWNMKTNEAYYSSNYFTMLGYQPDDFEETANVWFELIHPDDKQLLENIANDYLDGNMNNHKIEYRMKKKDGSWCWVLSRGGIVQWDNQNKPVRLVGTHVDITDFVKTRLSLKYSETLFRTAIDSFPFDLFALDSNQCYTIQNTVSKNMWGNIIGKCPEEVAENETSLSLWKKNNERVLAGETIRGEVTACVNGKDRIFYNIISPIWNEDKVTGILGINIDLDKNKKLENIISEHVIINEKNN